MRDFEECVKHNVDGITKAIRGSIDSPFVEVFNESFKGVFEKVIEELSAKELKIVNVNELFTITDTDYCVSLKDIGFNDESGELTVNDLIYEKDKINTIISTKFNKMSEIADGQTVFVFHYNESILKNNTLYEGLRSILKDGFKYYGNRREASVYALVLLETTEKWREFCPYPSYTNFA